MKFCGPLLSVKELERSKAFYRETLGLEVVMDFGANVTLTGGVFLQTEETWKGFIRARDVTYGGKDGELYFEEEDFDAFLKRIAALDVRFVHPAVEQPWGQRAVRFFDPDGHIVEVGETLAAVCRRFQNGGMTPEQIAARMDVPLEAVSECLNE